MPPPTVGMQCVWYCVDTWCGGEHKILLLAHTFTQTHKVMDSLYSTRNGTLRMCLCFGSEGVLVIGSKCRTLYIQIHKVMDSLYPIRKDTVRTCLSFGAEEVQVIG